MNGKSLGATLDVICKYSRTYTLKGTVLSIISISLLAVQNLSDFTPSFFLGVMQAIVGGCLANLYVVGINQLSDVEIDKVNKPYLPLASGELPVRTGILLTSLYAFLGFGLGWSVKSWPLKLGLFLWYAFGTAYSAHIPLLRWKRVPVLAATCLWSVQGAIIPILFHLHAQISKHSKVNNDEGLQTCIEGRSLLLSKHAIFVSGFMSIYGIVIALFKDVPDVEGDKINGINSFALQFGQKKVFWISIWLLEMAFGMAIIIGLSSARIWIRSIMVIGHSILGFILWRNANLVDLKSNEAIESFYLFIWKAIIGGCLANLYVAGINQLSDIEIDKVNKPYLPLASGELPVRTAILLTSAYAFLDIPDVEGDKSHGVNSFALQFGQKQMFWICVWLFEMAYGMAIVIGLSSPRLWIRSLMVISHGILGFILWRNANLVDLENNEAIECFYHFLWKVAGLAEE
ncbi:homogentisate phytyltransferase 1, chloroplastic [Helianthus annuus]|uniref:homogentisate phytyltransferase 1, chloroplastic n=1 Tax=Helianthus annuus TaxID=4232 RepID=UPI00165321FC|nr:homogentisate phytyltransferase 1, chloroplastic [Helianthus annuus]